jgi:hypothetical protein
LLVQHRPIDRSAIKPGRRPGLEPGERQRRIAHLGSQPLSRSLANPPTDDPLFTAKQHAAKECPCTQHDRRRTQRGPICQVDPADAASVDTQRGGFTRDEGQIALNLK